MTLRPSRRDVLAASAATAATTALGVGGALAGPAAGMPAPARSARLFEISLAQWSLHRAFRSGDLDNLEFARVAVEVGIQAVEYVNSFFKDKVGDFAYLGEMKKRAEQVGVRNLLIMVDGEGQLADADDAARRRAIENHFKWVAAASFLGCHSIRVNAAGQGEWDDVLGRAADSLVRLAEMAEPYGISVIVENHGGLSSNGEWLAAVMAKADHPRVGTLPDFGNFQLGGGEWYDRYDGVARLMPYAKAVSAKSHEFDEEGNEVRTDYARMMDIVIGAGYRGHVGVEYEGDVHSELDGIKLTRKLLVRERKRLEAEAR